MVAIDNFTKFAWASEMRTKQPDDLITEYIRQNGYTETAFQ